MKLTPERRAGGAVVHAIGPAGFRTDQGVFAALLMTPDRAVEWTPPPLAALTPAAIAPLIELEPEFILLGTGATLIRPPAAFAAAMEVLDIGVEPMDSRAAARAWGVLRGEGRTIGMALYPLG